MRYNNYWDNDKDRAFDEAIDEMIKQEQEDLQNHYEQLAKEWEDQEDITAQNMEHMLERIGAI